MINVQIVSHSNNRNHFSRSSLRAQYVNNCLNEQKLNFSTQFFHRSFILAWNKCPDRFDPNIFRERYFDGINTQVKKSVIQCSFFSDRTFLHGSISCTWTFSKKKCVETLIFTVYEIFLHLISFEVNITRFASTKHHRSRKR